MKAEAVLFDLDGTLLDTIGDLAVSMNNVLRGLGFPTHAVEAYKRFVGDGVVNLAKRVLPDAQRSDEELVARCVAAMRVEYAAHWADTTRPYPGVPELLNELTRRHVPKAVLSNKPHESTVRCVAGLLAEWEFDTVLGQQPGVPCKPDPTGAQRVAAQLGIAPARFLYLGDTGTDMRTACAAGMHALGALWGFRTADELRRHGAKRLMTRPTDLLDLLPAP
ncbi:MAG: HAD family hydrolase [Kiritimatiellae bacterium]|nr:HAD family hydrolase [Kiritimatiellia bacterium]